MQKVTYQLDFFYKKMFIKKWDLFYKNLYFYKKKETSGVVGCYTVTIFIYLSICYSSRVGVFLLYHLP